MYQVRLHPDKCPNKGSWIKKHQEGDIRDISNFQYDYHLKHGCMERIEKYRIDVKSERCKTCGHKHTIERKKIILK